MNVLLPAVATLAALSILPGWSFYFDVIPKVVLIVAAAGAALLLPRKWPSTNPRFQWFLWAMAAQAVAIVIGTAFSTHRWFSVFGGTWRKSGAIEELAVLLLGVIATGQIAADRSQLRLWLRITVLGSIPLSIYGIAQYFGIDPLLPATSYRFGEGTYTIVRPPATFGHAAYFATYLLYAVFAGIELARHEIPGVWKSAAIGASGLALFALALNGTRAALVGLAVAGVLFGIRQRLSWRWIAIGAIAAAALVAFYVSPAGEKLRARAFWSSEDSRGGSRLMLWRDTIVMAESRWLVGYGPETFPMEFPKHESIELARAYPDFYHESPHNIFLDALISKGALGLLPLILVVALGVFSGTGPMAAAFVAMLVAQQFTTFTLITELFFYFTLAIAVGDFKTPLVTIKRPTLLERALATFLIGFAVYLGCGDFLLGSARRALDRGDVIRAGELVDRARRWNANADVYFSRRILAQNPGAMVYAMRAAAHAPESADDPQNAFVNLAAFQATQDDAAGVEQSLRNAIAAAPAWYKPHWLLAQVLQREGPTVEAAQEARAAADRDGGKHPEVKQLLDESGAR